MKLLESKAQVLPSRAWIWAVAAVLVVSAQALKAAASRIENEREWIEKSVERRGASVEG